MPIILLNTIKKRIDFIKISKKGKRIFAKGFILQKYKRDLPIKENAARVGFTITKRIGNAVVRNKIRRRLRTIMREIVNNYLKKNYDYVIIANKKSLSMDYKELKSDIIKTIKE